MSDAIKHECGIAVVRLRHPLDWYRREHGDVLWGLRRLFLLMEKQHNRGQDGAGVASVKFDMPPGDRFMKRLRTSKRNPVERLFDESMRPVVRLKRKALTTLTEHDLKRQIPMLGEVMLGHLRYGTHGGRNQDVCHPYLRRNNVASRNLALAGNFNMTNSPELFAKLVEYGLHIVGDSDTQAVLERVGYMLDQEHEQLAAAMGEGSFTNLRGRELMREISAQLDVARIVRKAAEDFDGGYTLAGLIGNGDVFVCRDPAGIRPAFVLETDEVVAVASERAALATVFDVDPARIEALEPGHVLAVKRDGTATREVFTEPLPLRQCTFERIYFSRGNDPDIYRERKQLGRNLVPRVLDAIDHDVAHAVFGFIPNTAETAYLGLQDAMIEANAERAADQIAALASRGEADAAAIRDVLATAPRFEKVAHKDQKLRTFITHDAARSNLVGHVYDITHGTVSPEDSLVMLDDSIVRGTTLRESIVTMLSRLNPRQIVIASSAPPIMYPDCYGIDMSQLGRFIAFEAAISLLEDRDELDLLEEVEARCLAQIDLPDVRMKNHVAAIYDRFDLDTLSAKIAELIRPRDLAWKGELKVVYQSIDGLRAAMPEHTGDWYFTGDYPTAGGFRVLNTAFLNWRRRVDGRSY